MDYKLRASRCLQPAGVPAARPARWPAAPLLALPPRGTRPAARQPRAGVYSAAPQEPAAGRRLYQDDIVKEDARRLCRTVRAPRVGGRSRRQSAGVCGR